MELSKGGSKLIMDTAVEQMNRSISPNDDMYQGKDDHPAARGILNRKEWIV